MHRLILVLAWILACNGSLFGQTDMVLSLDGGSDFVEVLWNDWRDVGGEKVPFRVERREAGRTTLQVTITAALVSPKADDGRFSGR